MYLHNYSFQQSWYHWSVDRSGSFCCPHNSCISTKCQCVSSIDSKWSNNLLQGGLFWISLDAVTNCCWTNFWTSDLCAYISTASFVWYLHGTWLDTQFSWHCLLTLSLDPFVVLWSWTPAFSWIYQSGPTCRLSAGSGWLSVGTGQAPASKTRTHNRPCPMAGELKSVDSCGGLQVQVGVMRVGD